MQLNNAYVHSVEDADEDVEEEIIDKISRKDAIKAFYVFKSYCVKSSAFDTIAQQLKDAENFISSDIMSNPKQSKITDFFSPNSDE